MFRIFQLEALDQLLGAGAARSFSQDGDLRVKIIARLKISLGFPCLSTPLSSVRTPVDPVLHRKATRCRQSR